MLTALQNSAGSSDPAKGKSPTTRAGEWLLAKVQQGRLGEFAEVVTVTPELAQLLLNNNEGNRNIRQSLVMTIAADIEGGRWDLNGEAIIVAKDGSLNDGQHRLSAVLECGQPIRTFVVFGANRDSRFTVDSAATVRTAGDFLAMDGGVTNAQHCASVAKNLNLYRRGFKYFSAGTRGGGLGTVATKTMVRAEYLDHAKDINRAVVECSNGVGRKFGVSNLATAFVIIHRRNPVECNVFFSRLEAGVGLSSGDPILVLRNAIMIVQSGKRMDASRRVELVIRHWNAWRSGKKLSKVLPIVGNIPTVAG